MNAAAPLLPVLGARAHVDLHAPGQQPGIQALVAWQSALEGGRLAGAPADAPPALAQSLQRGLPLQLLPPSAWAWAAPTVAAEPAALGSLALWPALPDDVEWVDLALSLHLGGRWMRLQPQCVDEPDTPRSLLVLPDAECKALAAMEIALQPLRLAAAAPHAARWACRFDGLGVFLACLIDLGWPPA